MFIWLKATGTPPPFVRVNVHVRFFAFLKELSVLEGNTVSATIQLLPLKIHSPSYNVIFLVKILVKSPHK